MKKRLLSVFLAVVLTVVCFSFLQVQAVSSVTNWYYDQLTKDEKSIYDGFIKAVNGAGTAQIPLFSGYNYKFTSTFDLNGEADVQRFYKENAGYLETTGKIKTIFENAMAAATLDHPEYYWIDNSCTATINYSVSYTIGGRNIEMKTITIQAQTYSNVSEIMASVDQRLKQINAKGSDFEKVKTIHDFICNVTQYVEGNNAHDLYGSLFLGKAVCQGYAEAFKTACDYYNIPCICVEGEGINSSGKSEPHMWNYVKIDGKWYAVDSTWNDQKEGIFRDYFLVGSDSVATNFDNKSFSQTHINTKRPGGNSQENKFVFPELSKTAYNTGLVQATAQPTEKVADAVTPPPVATVAPTVSSGPLPTNAPLQTNAPATTPTGEAGTVEGEKSTPMPTVTSEALGELQELADKQVPEKTYIWLLGGFLVMVLLSVILSFVRKKR